LPFEERKTHTYIVGASGCGKSELLKSLIVQDIETNINAIIVIDPNGDFAKQVAKFKQNADPSRAGKLVYIDPFLCSPLTPVINPFDLPNKPQYYDPEKFKTILEKRGDQIQKALIQIFDDLGAGFSPKMESYLFPCICTVLLKPDGDLNDLLRFFIEGEHDDLIELGKRSPNPTHRELFVNGFQIASSTREGIRDKLRQMLNFSGLRDLVTGKSTVDLEAEIEARKLIVFNLSKGILPEKVSLYYGKLLISLLQSIAFQRAGIEEKKRTPTLLYIDEFQNYVNDDIKTILNEGRKYRIYLHLASQTVGQEMSVSIKRAVAGNTNIKIVGEQKDPETWRATAEYLTLEKSQVSELPKYQFYIKIGKGKPFLLHSTKEYLNNRNDMTAEQWEAVKAEQLAKYYRKPDHRPPQANNDDGLDEMYQVPPALLRDDHKPPRAETKAKFSPKYKDDQEG
jgi:DNA helicase HerA-like ATPase